MGICNVLRFEKYITKGFINYNERYYLYGFVVATKKIKYEIRLLFKIMIRESVNINKKRREFFKNVSAL